MLRACTNILPHMLNGGHTRHTDTHATRVQNNNHHKGAGGTDTT